MFTHDFEGTEARPSAVVKRVLEASDALRQERGPRSDGEASTVRQYVDLLEELKVQLGQLRLATAGVAAGRGKPDVRAMRSPRLRERRRMIYVSVAAAGA